jgi:hypothetical protein
MDINSIIAGLTANSQQQAAAASKTQTEYDAMTGQLVELQGTAESQARQLAGMAEQTGMDVAATNYLINAGRERNAAVAGMNPDDQTNLYIQSLAKITESRAARDAARGQYDKLNSVSFLDNPLGYIVAQLQLPQVAEQHNRALVAESTARGDMRTTIADINSKDTLIAANTAATLRGVEEQKAKAAGLQAQMQLSKLQADNISTIGQRTIQSLQIGTVGFQASKDMLNAQMSAEKFKLQQESVRLQRQQAYEIRQEQLKRKNLEAEALAEEQQRNQAAAALLGYLAVPNLKLLGQRERAEFTKVASSLQLGNDVYDSLQTIQTIGNQQVMAQTNGGMGKMVQGTSVAIRQAADAYLLTPEGQEAKLKLGDAERIGAQQWQTDAWGSGSSFGAGFPVNNPRWDTQFNPYKPSYMAVVDAAKGGTIPALKGNVAVEVISNLQIDPQVGNLTGKQLETVVQTLAQRVANGTLGADKAAQDWVTLNRIGATMNREQLGYEVMGMPAQERLILSVPGLAAFSDPQQLDGMDLASTKLALTKMAVQSSSVKNFGQIVQPFVPQRLSSGFDLLNIGVQTAAEKLAPKQ